MSAVVRNNNTLSTVRKEIQVATSSADLREESLAIPLTIVEGRWLIAGLSRKGLEARTHDLLDETLDDHAVASSESPFGETQHETYSILYRMFLALSEDEGTYDEEARMQLKETAEALLENLVPEQDDYDRPWAKTIEGLYAKWKYMVGEEAFSAASALTNNDGRPLSYGTLWQRHESETVPNYFEPQTIASLLELEEGELEISGEIWSEQMAKKLRKQNVPEPVITLIIQLQLQTEGLKLTQESLRKHLDITYEAANNIASARIVPRDQIDDLIDDIIGEEYRESFRLEWDKAYEAEQSQESLSDAFERIRDSHEWNNGMVAKLLHILPPEKRGKKKANRTEAYRPSHMIREMYQNATFSNQAPAKVVFDLVASDEEYEGDKTEREYLEQLFKQKMNRRFEVDGSDLYNSPLRLHRNYCGTSAEQLASVCDYSANDIMLIERGKKDVSDEEVATLMLLAEEFADARIAAVHEEIEEINADPDTVAAVVPQITRRLGGLAATARGLQDPENQMRSISQDRLRRIRDEGEVPSLPEIRRIVESGNSTVTDKLIADWYEQYPEYMAEDMQWEHPVARGFAVLVFEEYHSLKEFWSDKFEEDFSHSVLTRNFRQLNGEGHDFEWSTVSRYINARGLGLDDDRRLWLEQMFTVRNELTEALNEQDAEKVCVIVQEALDTWRAEATDPEQTEHMLGLTKAERGKI